jgi:hypothetical protein
MLKRLCAIWLVALIVLPFSAPFSTCDAARLFASDDSDQADPSTTHALPVARPGGRVKLAVVAAGPSFEWVSPPAPHRIPRDNSMRGFVRAPFDTPLRR